MEANATTSTDAGAVGPEPDGPSGTSARRDDHDPNDQSPDGHDPDGHAPGGLDAPDGPGASGDGGQREPGQLAPLPYDGVGSIAVGTGLWLVALVVMIPFVDDLRADGHLWWLATAACGFGLGLLGLVIVVRRRARLRRGATH
ncbi:DUF2530 domain-containing protein [Frankia nepalensis]|uniref:DUF2530 domain-containing protein n=1 Tax=Frankia nepalensis TaxID=1836974 RepID=UPI0027DDBC71|nr:DUF2530 domain-containing protein [Frankia nepalensis]